MIIVKKYKKYITITILDYILTFVILGVLLGISSLTNNV